MDSALEWWSQRPWWQCGLALLGGWLFLGGLGPLVMVPVVGLCIFPVVVQAADALESGEHTLGRALRAFWAELKKEWREIDPDRSAQVPPPCPPGPAVVDPVTGVTVHLNPEATHARGVDASAPGPVRPPVPAAPRTAPTRPEMTL